MAYLNLYMFVFLFTSESIQFGIGFFISYDSLNAYKCLIVMLFITFKFCSSRVLELSLVMIFQASKGCC